MEKHRDEVKISSSQGAFDPQGELCAQFPEGEAFATQKVAEGHDVRRLRLYDGQRLCTTIYADFTSREVMAGNFSDDPAETAFGGETRPSWAAFHAFVEKRCLPCAEPDLQAYLASIGMDDNSPLIVLQKDASRINADRQWIKLEVLK